MTGVQDGKGSFLSLGGYVDMNEQGHYEYLNTIYYLDPETYEFVLLDKRLPFSVDSITGMFVSAEMVVAVGQDEDNSGLGVCVTKFAVIFSVLLCAAFK